MDKESTIAALEELSTNEERADHFISELKQAKSDLARNILPSLEKALNICPNEVDIKNDMAYLKGVIKDNEA